jgi:hypothetical protein
MLLAVNRPSLPSTFRSLSLLRALNVAAVGLSLAALTAGIGVSMMGTNPFGFSGLGVALPTLLVGVVWALVLRTRATVAGSQLRWGWLASVPLAMANGALSCGVLMAWEEHGDLGVTIERFLGGLFLGATFGAFVWVPALLATLFCFGIPIALSQKRAQQGLAGEERGERIIGVVCALLAIVGLFLLIRSNAATPVEALDRVGQVVQAACGILGLSAGAAGAVLAQRRENRRRRFVRDVEAGAVAGFRVDAAPEGKVLVRVTSVGTGYRVANFEEELYALDEEGEARKAKSME